MTVPESGRRQAHPQTRRARTDQSHAVGLARLAPTRATPSDSHSRNGPAAHSLPCLTTLKQTHDSICLIKYA